MYSLINEIYESLLEKGVMLEARERSEKIVHEISKKIQNNPSLQGEALRDELYRLLLNAEREGFFTGFRTGVNIMSECRIPRMSETEK